MKIKVESCGCDLFLGLFRINVTVECSCMNESESFVFMSPFDDKKKPTPAELQALIEKAKDDAVEQWMQRFSPGGWLETMIEAYAPEVDEPAAAEATPEVAPEPKKARGRPKKADVVVETAPPEVVTALAVNPIILVTPEREPEIFDKAQPHHAELLRKLVAIELGEDWRTSNDKKLKVKALVEAVDKKDVLRYKGEEGTHQSFLNTVKQLLV